MVPAEKLSRTLLTDTPVRARASTESPKKAFQKFATRWLLLVGVALWTVGGQAQASVKDYQIDALRASYQAAVEQHQVLQVSFAQLSTPNRLVGVASSLQMGAPTSVLVVPSLSGGPQLAHHTTNSGGFALGVWKGALNLIVGSLEHALGTW